MKQRPRIYYSAEQKNLMWDRWQAGDSSHEIARLFDRGHSSVQGVLAWSLPPSFPTTIPCVAHAKTCQAITRFDWAQARGVSLLGEACVGSARWRIGEGRG